MKIHIIYINFIDKLFMTSTEGPALEMEILLDFVWTKMTLKGLKQSEI